MYDIYQSSKGPVKIADMHSSHLASAAAKLEREGGDSGLIAHLKSESHRREREWHDGEPEKFQEWATKNPERGADFHKRHGTSPKGAA